MILVLKDHGFIPRVVSFPRWFQFGLEKNIVSFTRSKVGRLLFSRWIWRLSLSGGGNGADRRAFWVAIRFVIATLSLDCDAASFSLFMVMVSTSFERFSAMTAKDSNTEGGYCFGGIDLLRNDPHGILLGLLSSVFELNEAGGSASDLEDDRYDYFSEDDSDIASVDHFSDGEEVFEIRNQKATHKPRKKPSKMIDKTFLTGIYNVLDMEEYVDKDSDKIIEAQDMVGDQFPIYDPSIKWKLMKSVIGERYESLDKLKRDLVIYALAKGYKLYYEVNNPRNCMLNVVEIQKKGNFLLDYSHHGC
nr:cellulose synthase [Tanacetum cinerariifolium]